MTFWHTDHEILYRPTPDADSITLLTIDKVIDHTNSRVNKFVFIHSINDDLTICSCTNNGFIIALESKNHIHRKYLTRYDINSEIINQFVSTCISGSISYVIQHFDTDQLYSDLLGLSKLLQYKYDYATNHIFTPQKSSPINWLNRSKLKYRIDTHEKTVTIRSFTFRYKADFSLSIYIDENMIHGLFDELAKVIRDATPTHVKSSNKIN